MTRSFDDFLKGVPPQYGNGGRPPQPTGVFKDRPAAPVTALDKTTAEVKRMTDEDAQERAQKTARLKAAREARDAKSGNGTGDT